jgi:Zn-dependent membrane protease YugP
MDGTLKWIASGVVGILGVVGLFLAANAHDRGIYAFGLGLAAFAIIYVFAQMKQSFDASDRAHGAASHESGVTTAERGLVGKVTS